MINTRNTERCAQFRSKIWSHKSERVSDYVSKNCNLLKKSPHFDLENFMTENQKFALDLMRKVVQKK
jgi:hypothetical protein